MAKVDIRILGPGDEAALVTSLLPRLDLSMSLRGNLRAAELMDNGSRGERTYTALFADGHITVVAAHSWNGNIILQNPRLSNELWRMAVRTSRRGINGVLGARRAGAGSTQRPRPRCRPGEKSAD